MEVILCIRFVVAKSILEGFSDCFWKVGAFSGLSKEQSLTPLGKRVPYRKAMGEGKLV